MGKRDITSVEGLGCRSKPLLPSSVPATRKIQHTIEEEGARVHRRGLNGGGGGDSHEERERDSTDPVMPFQKIHCMMDTMARSRET